MKISVLIENTSRFPELISEHGLSLFIETKGHRILFDSGQTGAFADNAEKIGVNIKDVDMAALSHGHYDHGGGIGRFFEINEKARFYISKNAFTPCFNGTKEYIGLDTGIKKSGRIVYCGDEEIIDGSISIHSCNKREKIVPTNPFGLNKLSGGEISPDDFNHEQYLLIRENGRSFLISGCSHKGILNIENWFKPDFLIGGFHLYRLNPDNPNDRKKLEETAEKLLSFPTKYYTGHCTGERQFDFLKKIMGERIEYLSTGRSFEL